MKTIKINGGSFEVATVLSYSCDDFVEYYNKLFSGWMTEEKRIATLKEVYKIAQDINTIENDSLGVHEKTRRFEYRPDRENSNRGNKGIDNCKESGSDASGDSI